MAALGGDQSKNPLNPMNKASLSTLPAPVVQSATVTADGGFNHSNFLKKPAIIKGAPKKAATKPKAFFDSDDDFAAPVSQPAQQ